MTTKDKIIKSVDTELKQALYVVMEPDAIDAHGDVTTKEEILKACHNFNEFCASPANLCHLVPTTTFKFVESYVAPIEMNIDGHIVPAGTWLAKVQFLDDELWEAAKNGDFNGLSIGALATIEVLE